MPSLSPLSASFLTQINQKRADACLVEMNEKTNDSEGDLAKAVDNANCFQYWPETVTDSKAVNYQQKDIPGGSLPLYQWISGGERLITFTAVFTTDVDLEAEKQSRLLSLSGDDDIVARLKSAGLQRRNVDIRAAVAWLRRYMYPRYTSDSDGKVETHFTYAPAKLLLIMPNSGIGLAGGDAINLHSIKCIMTQCDVTTEQYFPNGLPRIATVQLSFAQIAQYDGGITFPGRTTEMDGEANGDYAEGTKGYRFTPKSLKY